MGPRWHLMLFMGSFMALRPEELTEVRRSDVDPAKRVV